MNLKYHEVAKLKRGDLCHKLSVADGREERPGLTACN